jgi:flagellar export protein FliJ
MLFSLEMGFIFSLETLLRVAREKLDLLKEEFKLIKGLLDREEKSLKELENLKSLHLERFPALNRDPIEVRELLFFENYLTALREKIRSQKGKVGQIKESLETKKGELIQTSTRVKLLEKAKEKEFLNYKASQRHKESKRLDQWAQRDKKNWKRD